MKIETFEYYEVKEDGTLTYEDGAVNTRGGIIMSDLGGGCGMNGCNCSEGHWISISEPRTNEGVVRGITAHFDGHDEYCDFLNKGNVTEK